MISKLIAKVLEWLKDHTIGVLLTALGIGVAGATAGGVEAHKAKKINKRALSIQQEALDKHEEQYQLTQQTLAQLGEAEKTAIDSFLFFADTMARIQGRPQMKTNIFSSVKLPSYEPEEIKCLSNDLQMALAGVSGAGAGALAGLAAFGASAVVAAPAMISTGIVLCVKGFGLKKKAIENERQAKKLQKSVDEIVAFYAELRGAANTFRNSVSAVYTKYNECLLRVNSVLMTKNTWKEFTRTERKNVENTVLLARLLYQMCKTNVVIQQEEDEKIETINTGELTKLEKQSAKLLEGIA